MATLVLDSFVEPFSINFSIFIHFLACLFSPVFDLEVLSIICFDLFFIKLFRTFEDQFISKLILMRLEILEELYANEYQLNDKLLELKVGKYMIYMFSRYSKNNRSQKSTWLYLRLEDANLKYILLAFWILLEYKALIFELSKFIILK